MADLEADLEIVRRESFYNICTKHNITLGEGDPQLVNEIFHSINILRGGIKNPRILPAVILSIEQLFDRNEELKTISHEVIQSFVGYSTQPSKTPPEESKRTQGEDNIFVLRDVLHANLVLYNLTALSKDEGLKQSIGSKSAEVFQQQIKTLARDYNKTEYDKKVEVLLKGLGDLEDRYNNKATESNFSKIKTIVFSYTQYLICCISGNNVEAIKHQRTALETIEELTQSSDQKKTASGLLKSTAQIFKSKKEEISGFREREQVKRQNANNRVNVK